MGQIHAVGVLVKDRWDLTRQTLESLFYSEQPKSTYDLYLIDNGSTEEVKRNLKEYAVSGIVPVHKLISIPSTSIASAWNLFFMLTEGYLYRTKMDNDIILHNTVKLITPKSKAIATPNDADPMAGAPRSRSIIKGIGQTQKKIVKSTIKSHSCFLQHMEEFGKQYNVGMVGLVTVPPNISFSQMLSEMSSKKYDSRPFLSSGCIQISQDAFKRIGYLDERLVRFCFREYSQRAIKSKINIGYHPYYGAFHAGFNSPVLSQTNLKENKEPENIKNSENYFYTKWLEHKESISNICKDHKIVSIE